MYKWYDIIASMHAFIASPPNDEAAVTRTVSDCATCDAESGITVIIKDMENLITLNWELPADKKSSLQLYCKIEFGTYSPSSCAM